MRSGLALFVLLLFGCGRYDEFRLPSVPTSPHFNLNWHTATSPTIPRGAAVDVLNPSVARWGDQYVNLYSQFDGVNWSTALAISRDGEAWTLMGKVISPTELWEGKYIAANGGIVASGRELLYAYQAGDKGKTVIGVASSTDGKVWRKNPKPILTQGPRMSWDEISLGDPYLIAAEGNLYLFYLGEDRARRQRLGLARSRDGFTWTKLRSGPLLELGGSGDFDENGLGEPAVFAANGGWAMLYTGRDRQEKRAMGYAVSKDGAAWTKLRAPVLRGAADWNSAVVCDATVLVEAGRVRIWYGGGNLPRPDERLNGQIGYAELLP